MNGQVSTARMGIMIKRIVKLEYKHLQFPLVGSAQKVRKRCWYAAESRHTKGDIIAVTV